MRFSFAIVLSALAVGSALAGHNCKCQDDRGQYNELTAECCYQQGEIGQLLYYPGPNHQCASSANLINSGAFVTCCQALGAGGAFCWD